MSHELTYPEAPDRVHDSVPDVGEDDVRITLTGEPDAVAMHAFARALFWAIADGRHRRVVIDATGCRFADLEVLQRLGTLGSRTAGRAIEVEEIGRVLKLLGVHELLGVEAIPLEGA